MTEKTREQIEELWRDQELCEDFSPVLKELLDERDALKNKLQGIEKNYGKGASLPVTDEQYKYLQTEVSGEHVGKTLVQAIIDDHKDLKYQLKRTQDNLHQANKEAWNSKED